MESDCTNPLAARRCADALLDHAETGISGNPRAPDAARQAADALEPQRQTARALADNGEFQLAIEIWREIERSAPGDMEAAERIVQAAIRASRETTGLDWPLRVSCPAGSEAPVDAPRRDSAAALALAAEVLETADAVDAKIPRTPIQQLEAALRVRSAAVSLYLELAELYLADGREFDAERTLARGRTATDNDPHVERMWEDVLLLRHAKWVELLRAEVEQNDDAQSRAAWENAVQEGQQQRIEIFEARVAREPYHAESRFQLGVALMAAGRSDEAQAHLEQVAEAPELRGAALLQIADLFRGQQKFAAALRYYRRAADPGVHPGVRDVRRVALTRAEATARELQLPLLADHYRREIQRFDESRPCSVPAAVRS